MQTLYKVLFVLSLLFVAAGVIYLLTYLPKVPSTPAEPPQSRGSIQMYAVTDIQTQRTDYWKEEIQ